jgi:hypothetical protein
MRVLLLQISDHYMFFLRGFPEELWVTLPDILQQGTAADTRPAGEGALEPVQRVSPWCR